MKIEYHTGMNKAVKRDISNASHKIALLAVLVAGVLFSLLIVSIKSKVRLEKPINLVHTGFSVSLPAGERWETQTAQWVFSQEHNYFYAGAIEQDKGVTTTVVQWRYLICPDGENPNDVFTNRGKDLGGYSGQKKIFIGNGFGANLATFRDESGEHICLALVILEPGRAAELEVRGRDVYVTEDVFKAVLAGASFESNGLLNKGRLLTETILSNPPAAPKGQNNAVDRFFLLDSSGLMDGFLGLRQGLTDNGKVVRSVMFAGLGANDIYRNNEFSRTLDGRITWKFIQTGSGLQFKREILLEVSPDGNYIMTDFTAKTEKKRKISSAYWPEITDSELFKTFVHSDINECVIDMLMAQGQVLPVYMTKAKQGDNQWQISLAYLHTPELGVKVNLNTDGTISSRIIEGSTRHIVTPCDREDILARYPQQAAFFQKLFE